ncbi:MULTISPECIES: hypothetical protein [unclassified Flavobacterium]|uniref:hypothetical protein n=1 Tax=unclassified Flavobacterium TaxID=196869 RepID=UPI000A3D7287|nr:MULTISPECIES: hypothetical protein [unclassified Flavobacterium]MEA9415878.1 hypothetical protein [Flavobacterium sp. PL02]OUL61112.1 hypothetical protein B8T70_16880 [Flavobacterium sp. AJR]
MEIYTNKNGQSGVKSYEIGADYITVKFNRTAKPYKYSYLGKAGSKHVENMKHLAIKGAGLNSYINTHVKFKYDVF